MGEELRPNKEKKSEVVTVRCNSFVYNPYRVAIPSDVDKIFTSCALLL